MPDGAIEAYFRSYFDNWNIELPAEAVAARSGGHIYELGWHIGYVWGSERGEEYLEVLAQHRMTDDRHFRVFASGQAEDLPAPSGFVVYSADATQSEREKLDREHVEQNRVVYADLRERGLLPPHGENLGSHEINEYLRSGGEADA